MATTASAALSSNGNLVGALSGACLPRDARKSHRTATRSRARRRAVGRAVPKKYSEAFLERAKELLRRGESASAVMRAVNKEFAPESATVSTISAIRDSLGLPGRGAGRPLGTGKQYSPNRERAKQLAAQQPPLTLQQVADQLGITYQAVQQLLKS